MFFSVRSGSKTREKIIIGENSPRYAYCWIPISTHAEIDALQKLKNEYSSRKGRPFRMNLLVVRMSKTGLLNVAVPCQHCIKQLAAATFVNIKNVYYSNDEGHIQCQKFDDLVNSPYKFISSGYRNRMGMPSGRTYKSQEAK